MKISFFCIIKKMKMRWLSGSAVCNLVVCITMDVNFAVVDLNVWVRRAIKAPQILRALYERVSTLPIADNPYEEAWRSVEEANMCLCACAYVGVCAFKIITGKTNNPICILLHTFYATQFWIHSNRFARCNCK